MMITKGSLTSLVQVTGLIANVRRIMFAAADSLNLNQPADAAGSLAALNAAAPANTPGAISVTRVRMLTYYIDATIDPAHPRLVRRVNNGDPIAFSNALGTTVGFDIENLQFAFDINDGLTNPGAVKMTAADLGGAGACAPNPCTPTQIRKVDVAITGRSRRSGAMKILRNTLQSQVSLRGMAFVDRYRG